MPAGTVANSVPCSAQRSVPPFGSINLLGQCRGSRNVCTSTAPPGSDGCFSDFGNPVVGEGGATGVLIAGAVPFAHACREISPQEQYLYLWELGDRLPVLLARQVLVAA